MRARGGPTRRRVSGRPYLKSMILKNIKIFRKLLSNHIRDLNALSTELTVYRGDLYPFLFTQKIEFPNMRSLIKKKM